MKPDEAFKKLMEGNERFVKSKMERPHQDEKRRTQIAEEGQEPFAIVAYCSDSRSPAEQIFDQGNGDIFGIRIAGHVIASDDALGSIQYAIEHTTARLVVVLGHTDCGAVKATMAGGDIQGPVKSIVKTIQPAVDAAKKKGGDVLNGAIQEHVKRSVELLRQQDFIKNAERCIEVVGAVYDLESGKVSTEGLTRFKIEGNGRSHKHDHGSDHKCCCKH
ncbi:MAG: carbonic anhydrase [Verrucomicrobiota bacterium]